MLNLLQFFAYEHLPPHLQAVSKPFGDLAQRLAAELPSNSESTAQAARGQGLRGARGGLSAAGRGERWHRRQRRRWGRRRP